jgi:hypothetical protein
MTKNISDISESEREKEKEKKYIFSKKDHAH